MKPFSNLVTPRRRDTETGLYEEVYSDDVIVTLLEGTRLSTGEVAKELDCHRTTAHKRLSELEEEGVVVSTEAGNTYIWELTSDDSV